MGRKLEPARSHKVDLPAAAEQARAYRKAPPTKDDHAGAFLADAIRRVLDQPGCVGLRYYLAKKKSDADNREVNTMVLVGVDGDGNDMTSGEILNTPFLCPPFCADPNALNT